MKAFLVVAVTGVMLAGCAGMTNREKNITLGAAIGAGAGAAIGAASSGPAGGWAGAAIGGTTGGILGYLLTPPDSCYVRIRGNRLKAVPC